MIYLNNEIPFLINGENRNKEIDVNMLVGILDIAASKAGYDEWWLSDHVVESILAYLKYFFPNKSISNDDLENILKSVLEMIGYGEVANKINLTEECCKVSLLELANNASFGYELTFFLLLENLINKSINKYKYFNFFDLVKCIQKLNCTSNWNGQCESFYHEVVYYIRQRLLLFKKSHNLFFTLC